MARRLDHHLRRLALIIGWIGLSLILEEPLGGRGSSWRELIPRLLLGLVAAAASLWWCALVIDLAHAVSGFIAATLDVTPADLLLAPVNTLLTAVKSGSVGIALLLAFIYLIYAVFCFYLLLQMVLRLALIDLLLALAPAAMGLWILPQTSGWSRQWLRMFATAVAQQAVQLIALALGIGFLAELAEIGPFEPARDLVWKLLMAVGFIYLATRVPSMLGNGNTFDSWLSTLYFAFSLPTNMARSAASFVALGGLGLGREVSGSWPSICCDRYECRNHTDLRVDRYGNHRVLGPPPAQPEHLTKRNGGEAPCADHPPSPTRTTAPTFTPVHRKDTHLWVT